MFKLFKKEKVEYDGKGRSARCNMKINKYGQKEMEIEGEKYRSAGFPTAHMLGGKSFVRLKKLLSGTLIWAAESCEPNMVSYTKMKEPVRAIYEAFEEMKKYDNSDMVTKVWKPAQTAICHIMQEDDAYCYRLQVFLEEISKRANRIKLSKADKYYFRGKIFDVDKTGKFMDKKPSFIKKVIGKIIKKVVFR